jgi:hypothetical protein
MSSALDRGNFSLEIEMECFSFGAASRCATIGS